MGFSHNSVTIKHTSFNYVLIILIHKIMVLRHTQLPKNISCLSFMGKQSSLVSKYYIFFIHLSFDENTSCFQDSAQLNCAAVHRRMHTSRCCNALTLLRRDLETGMLRPTEPLHSTVFIGHTNLPTFQPTHNKMSI